MGTASFAGWVFRIDPTSVQWDFKVRTNTTYTLGGKVVQILGTELGNMQVSGEFGRGFYQEQRTFLDAMRDVGEDQVANFATSDPPRFVYPAYGWDFSCYLVSYSGEGGKAVTWDPSVINPKWTLTLHIMEDNSGLTQAATDRFISRLAEGIGWQINEYNGPGEWETVRDYLQQVGASDIPHLLQMAYGAGDASAPTSANNGEQVTVDGAMTAGEIAYVAMEAGFAGDNLVIAIAVALGESSGNPNAEGDTTITTAEWGPSVGLWQVRSLNAESGTGGERDATRLKDPFFNARSAWSISSHGSNFSPWTVYRESMHLQYMDQALEGSRNPTRPASTNTSAQGGQSTAGAAFQ